MNKYFLYARKSTDVEDKQVLSIEAQLTELRAYARQEKLEIVEELIEKQSAKMPGRPIFNNMLDRIEAGEANGIIAWNPDRLARIQALKIKLQRLLDSYLDQDIEREIYTSSGILVPMQTKQFVCFACSSLRFCAGDGARTRNLIRDRDAI